jgi:GntR family transcriptional regulator
MARTPLYKTAETEMIRRIRSGDWPVGLRLPNEFVLAEEFGVSQGTMRRALISLEGMGLLDRKPGRGTLVADPAAAPAPDVRALGHLLAEDGSAPVFEVYRARTGRRSPDASEVEQFGPSRLVTLERTLRRDGARTALDEVIAPEALTPALHEGAAVDLADLLSDAGILPGRIEEHLTATVTTMSESVALSCDRYTALLVLTRTARDVDGQALARQTLRLIAEGLSYSA